MKQESVKKHNGKLRAVHYLSGGTVKQVFGHINYVSLGMFLVGEKEFQAHEVVRIDRKLDYCPKCKSMRVVIDKFEEGSLLRCLNCDFVDQY